jgi:TPR repeat protein
MKAPFRPYLITLLATSSLTGCGAAELVRKDAPTVADATEEKCDASAESTNSFVLDLPPERRSDIELAIGSKNLTVVSFNCKQLKILKTCKASGTYSFRGTSPKERVLSLESADQIRAALPLGGVGIAASFESEAKTGTKFDLGMVLVGQQVGSASSFTAAELTGNCKGATHVITGAKMGAFAMGTSSKADLRTAAEIFGAGASAGSSSSKLTKARDGSVEACQKAEAGADAPPTSCDSVLAIELTKLEKGMGTVEVDFTFSLFYGDDGCIPKGKDAKTCEQECNDGDGKGCRMLAISLIEGQEMDKNIPRGLQLLKKGCDLGDVRACSALSNMLWYEKRFDEARPLAERACDIGNDPDGCFNLGLILEMSEKEEDKKKALKAYEKACSAGVKTACDLVYGPSKAPDGPEPTE